MKKCARFTVVVILILLGGVGLISGTYLLASRRSFLPGDEREKLVDEALGSRAHQSREPRSSGRKKLLVDDFESGDFMSAFATRWRTYTDVEAGGQSTATIELIDGGARGSKKALRLSGRVTTDFPYGFAGVGVFFDHAGTTKDLTSFTGLRFYARGDGDTYQVQVLCAAVKDHNEFSKEFVAPQDWTLVEVPFSKLAQSPWWGTRVRWTGSDIRGVAFQTASAPREAYQLEIDEISFY